MLFQLVTALNDELDDDRDVVFVEPVTKCLLQPSESVIDVVGNVVEDGAVGDVAAECKQMRLPKLWIDGFLGRPVVAQPDVGDVCTGIGWYRLKFVVEVVEWRGLVSHFG